MQKILSAASILLFMVFAVSCPKYAVVKRETMNDIKEVATDRDGDGAPDEWVVLIRGETRFRAGYMLSDTNNDRIPDRVTVEYGRDQQTIVGGFDDDEDGIFDYQQISMLSGTKGELRRIYVDLNMDGVLDTNWTKVIGKDGVISESVLMDKTWCEVDLSCPRTRLEKYVRCHDSPKRAVFVEGAWRWEDKGESKSNRE